MHNPIELIMKMKTSLRNPDSFKKYCEALTFQAKNESVKNAVAQDEIRLILAAMRLHATRCDIQALLCDLIWRLTFEDSLLQNLFCSQNTIQHVFQSLSSSFTDASVVNGACRIISNLCQNPKTLSSIAELDGINALINVLSAHENNFSLLSTVFSTISSLCKDNMMNSKISSQEHGMNRILDALIIHGAVANLVFSAFHLLAILCDVKGVGLKLRKKENVHLILSVLHYHIEYAALHRVGNIILLCILKDNKAANEMACMGGIVVLLPMLCFHLQNVNFSGSLHMTSKEPETVAATMHILYLLTHKSLFDGKLMCSFKLMEFGKNSSGLELKGSNQKVKNCSKLEGHMVGAILKTMQIYMVRRDIMRAAMKCMGSLVQLHCVRHALSFDLYSKSPVPTIVQCMALHHKSRGIAECATHIVTVLLSSPEAKFNRTSTHRHQNKLSTTTSVTGSTTGWIFPIHFSPELSSNIVEFWRRCAFGLCAMIRLRTGYNQLGPAGILFKATSEFLSAWESTIVKKSKNFSDDDKEWKVPVSTILQECINVVDALAHWMQSALSFCCSDRLEVIVPLNIWALCLNKAFQIIHKRSTKEVNSASCTIEKEYYPRIHAFLLFIIDTYLSSFPSNSFSHLTHKKTRVTLATLQVSIVQLGMLIGMDIFEKLKKSTHDKELKVETDSQSECSNANCKFDEELEAYEENEIILNEASIEEKDWESISCIDTDSEVPPETSDIKENSIEPASLTCHSLGAVNARSNSPEQSDSDENYVEKSDTELKSPEPVKNEVAFLKPVESKTILLDDARVELDFRGQVNDGLSMKTWPSLEPMESSDCKIGTTEPSVEITNEECFWVAYEGKSAGGMDIKSQVDVWQPYIVPLAEPGAKCPYAHSVKFDSCFESGNLLRAVQRGNNEYDLLVRPDLHTYRHTQWFYFSLTNIQASEDSNIIHTPVVIKFNIINLTKPETLYGAGGMRPVLYSHYESEHRVYSDKCSMPRGWHRCGENIVYHPNNWTYTKPNGSKESFFTLSFSVTFPRIGDTYRLAHCYPYTTADHSRHMDVIMQNKERACNIVRSVLCITVAKFPCELITITENAALRRDNEESQQKQNIVISARVHPGETPSSWVLRGMLDYLTGPDPDALLLRQLYVFYIVPFLNPDGVMCGNNRCNLSAVDLNRQWRAPDRMLHPTIFHLKNLIKCKHASNGVIMYMDLHGHSRKQNMFLYGVDEKLPAKASIANFPELISRNRLGKMFISLKDCSNVVWKGREATARVVVSRELGVPNSFTMESSFCGISFGPLAGYHLNTGHLQGAGRAICETLVKSFSNSSITDAQTDTKSLNGRVGLMQRVRNLKQSSVVRAVYDQSSLSSSLKQCWKFDDSTEITCRYNETTSELNIVFQKEAEKMTLTPRLTSRRNHENNANINLSRRSSLHSDSGYSSVRQTRAQRQFGRQLNKKIDSFCKLIVSDQSDHEFKQSEHTNKDIESFCSESRSASSNGNTVQSGKMECSRTPRGHTDISKSHNISILPDIIKSPKKVKGKRKKNR